MKPPEVLHVDNHVLVVAKPACLPTVADDSGDESLQEWAKAWIAREFDKPGAVFLGVVHRLDRPVSGVLVFGRTSKGAERLSRQFRERSVEKVYWALTEGELPAGEGVVEHWLHKDRERNRVSWSASERDDHQRARTAWRALERTPTGNLVELRPESGRSHQLRVAMASLGCPLLGDLKYGASGALPDRSVGLHARALAFDHPTRDERLRFEAPLPELECWRTLQGREG